MAMPADIAFDLGLAPSVLAALRNPQTVRRIVLAAAQSYNDDVHNWIDAGHSYALGHQVEGRTEGSLEDQTNWEPHPEGGLVYSNASYARYVEEGTGEFAGHRRWVINPKEGRKGLKIPVNTGGGFIVRRSVIHPGSRAFPFFMTDLENRQNNMISAGRSVLASQIAGAANG